MRALALILPFLLACGPTWGWSKQGHALVGELAASDLSPTARREVDRLLAGEPVPTLAGVASWADEIRAEGRVSEHPLGERSERWHYINFHLRGTCEYVPVRDCPDGNCVIAAINNQRAILADHARPLSERREALKFLVHFLGDVHQPMHAGNRDDRGGNNYQIQYRGKGAPAGEGTQLHRIWDYWLVRSAGLDHAGYTARLLQSPVPTDDTIGADNRPLQWALESCRLIGSDHIYPNGHRLGDAYLDRHRPLAERRLRQAGARLAELINAALDPPTT